MGNLGDFTVKLPLRYAFVSVSVRLKTEPAGEIFSPHGKDQASGGKSTFFLTKMKSEFQPFLYLQVEEPKEGRLIGSVSSSPCKERPGKKGDRGRPCHTGFMAEPRVQPGVHGSLTSSVNFKRSLGCPSYCIYVKQVPCSFMLATRMKRGDIMSAL